MISHLSAGTPSSSHATRDERALLRAVGLDVHELRAVLELADHLLRRRDEARARVVGLVAHRAIELGRVADRFVDREPEVRRIEDQIVAPGFDGLGRQLLGGERRPALGVARHVERLDVLPALPARRQLLAVGLEIAVADRRAPRMTGPTRMNVCVTFVPSEVTSVFTSRSSWKPELTKRTFFTLSAASLAASSKRDLLLDRHVDRIAPHRRHPRAGHRRHRRELDGLALHGARGARHARRLRARPSARPPASCTLVAANPQQPFDQRADAEAVRLLVADAADLALAGGE